VSIFLVGLFFLSNSLLTVAAANVDGGQEEKDELIIAVGRD
jgi:hypothetical protein